MFIPQHKKHVGSISGGELKEVLLKAVFLWEILWWFGNTAENLSKSHQNHTNYQIDTSYFLFP